MEATPLQAQKSWESWFFLILVFSGFCSVPISAIFGQKIVGVPVLPTGLPRKDSKGIGWERAHVAIDDHSRVGHIQIWPDETSSTAWRALIATVRYFRSLGVHIERILTDNGS